VNFSNLRISVPPNLSGQSLHSPLTIAMTLTNVGGGGGIGGP
jgi:hypothetical protein